MASGSSDILWLSSNHLTASAHYLYSCGFCQVLVADECLNYWGTARCVWQWVVKGVLGHIERWKMMSLSQNSIKIIAIFICTLLLFYKNRCPDFPYPGDGRNRNLVIGERKKIRFVGSSWKLSAKCQLCHHDESLYFIATRLWDSRPHNQLSLVEWQSPRPYIGDCAASPR